MEKVKIYTTPTCSWCAKTKALLRENSIDFDEIDVSKDHEAAHELIHTSGQMGVPVTEINGTLIIGYDKPALLKALHMDKGRERSAA